VTELALRFPQSTRALPVAGMVVGFAAALVALPPITARTPVLSILLGLAAIAIGAISWRQGERRWAGYAVAAGLFGMTIGILATRSSTENLDDVVVWGTLLAATLRYATPLLFASLGGLFSERSGVVNIGLEGMMLTGAFFAIWGADVTGTWTLGLVIAFASGALLGLLHAFFSISLRADQIVVGTAINLVALGLTTYLFIKIYGAEGTPTGISSIPDVSLGFLDDVPAVGSFLDEVFGQLNLMIWAGFVLVFAVWVVVFKTPIGLRLRSVGEHPRAADTVGLNVYAIRYVAVTFSGVLAAAGGAYLSLGFVETFDQNMTAGRGFIALAALIFGNWRPFGAAAACLLFGFSSALSDNLQTYSTSISTLFEALPYALTLVAVAGVIGRSIPPAAVGRPYVKQ
jgi:general nucleoside transport system permease protein